MAAKGKVLLLAIASLLVSTAAVASIPRSTALDPPPFDRYALDDRERDDNDALLAGALDRTMATSESIARLAETRVRGIAVLAPFERQPASELSRALRRASGFREFESASDATFCAGDPVNCKDPTGLTGESDLADDRRAIAAKRSARAAERIRQQDAAERQLNDALQQFGTARMIELRKQGIPVRAGSIVAILPDGLTAITASGRVIPNPYAGVAEDQTANLVVTVAGLKVVAPVIANAFRVGGLRAGGIAVADEAVGQLVGVNPSTPVNLVRAGRRRLRMNTSSMGGEFVEDSTRMIEAPLAENNIIVLGHRPVYYERAAQLGARRFRMTDDTWNRLTDAERWALNQQFLDEAIARESEIVLATPLDEMRRGSFFEREINYLRGKGFRLSDDGTRMVRAVGAIR